MKTLPFAAVKQSLVHPTRTTIAAVLALVAARVLGLPEVYWAPITTLIVMQSNLGAALTISRQRLMGTALGAFAAALLASGFGSNLADYGAGIFGVGLVCAALRLDRAAYRFAGVALTVIMLVRHAETIWGAALHRFIEVALGIVVGVIITALWPDSQEAEVGNAVKKD
jgi:uncharacterized membrane protein YccC